MAFSELYKENNNNKLIKKSIKLCFMPWIFHALEAQYETNKQKKVYILKMS